MKDFVATRPRRPRSGRVVAGVAAGIGRRYGVDPVIIRIALVVGAIYGGAGLICYLLGWLLLAQDGDDVSPIEALLGRGRSSTSKALTVVLCICLIPAAHFVFGGYFSMVAGLLLLGTGLFLLHRYRSDKGQITPTTTSADPEAGPMTDSTPTSQFGTTANPEGPQDAVPDQPPSWDPLGAAPFAWDLPEPNSVPPAPPVLPRQRKPRVGLATLGVLFLTGAVLAVTGTTVAWLTPGHIAGILAAIVGVGLVAGAFAHSGRGLIPLAVLLSAVAFGMTATHFDGVHGVGNDSIRPTSLNEVQPLYEHSIGSMTLDLSDLPDVGSVTTKVSLGAGHVTVLVPQDAQVNATCSTTAGSVSCLGHDVNGPGNPAVTATQAAANNDQLTINLTVEDGAGRVDVVNHD